MPFYHHWDRLDTIAREANLDIRTLLWENPFLPASNLPYLPPNGFDLNTPDASLTPMFATQDRELARLKAMLDGAAG